MNPSATHAEAVTQAALARASALRRSDRFALAALLHPGFIWTSHRGDVLDRDAYLAANCGGDLHWHDQQLADIAVAEAGDPAHTAVLTAVVTDLVSRRGELLRHRMRLTLTWVRAERADDDALDPTWVCLAGHAGPRLEPASP